MQRGAADVVCILREGTTPLEEFYGVVRSTGRRP
jgi:hypothetical protein